MADNRLLIVDDIANFRKILKTYLRSLKFDSIDEAQDGHSAYNMVHQALNDGKGYKLVLADINMPNGTGLELLRWLRTETRTKEIPIILATAESDIVQVSEAVSLGVDDYIVKPFAFDALQEKVRNVYFKRYGVKLI